MVSLVENIFIMIHLKLLISRIFISIQFFISAYAHLTRSLVSGVKLSKVLNDQNTQRSEEHTSELQSRFDLVCRLLLEKKKKTTQDYYRNKSRKAQTGK